MKFKLYFFILLVNIILSCSLNPAQAELVNLFPIQNYNQNIDHWLDPKAVDYNTPLLSVEQQHQRFVEFYQHTYGEASPWSAAFVYQVLQVKSPNDIETSERKKLNSFDNTQANQKNNTIAYGEDFRPYDLAGGISGWISSIRANIDLPALTNLSYKPMNRAIAIRNLNARSLPTDDPGFHHYKIAGEGYPFDNLQVSAIWSGTPLYVLAISKDKAWSLVLTDSFIGWVNSDGIAYANSAFIKKWQAAAQKSLAAITQTPVSILDDITHQFLFKAYIGMTFPAIHQANGDITLLIPGANQSQQAMMTTATVAMQDAAIVPLSFTPHMISRLLQSQLNRPYGWGGVYLYNDCSAEIKNLYAPFGIWFPRHSAEQIKQGHLYDLTSATPEKRLANLKILGKKWVTIIYIDGHILIYIGSYQDEHGKIVEMTYQNIWGLRPADNQRRAVIGKSVFLPLLLQYPEDTTLQSLLARPHFIVARLDQMPSQTKNRVGEFSSIMSPGIEY